MRTRLELLDRCVPEGAKNSIDTRLISRALSLEPLYNILLYAQRNGCFGRLRLKTTTNDAAHNVSDISLWMLGSNRHGVFGFEPGPVSLRLH